MNHGDILHASSVKVVYAHEIQLLERIAHVQILLEEVEWAHGQLEADPGLVFAVAGREDRHGDSTLRLLTDLRERERVIETGKFAACVLDFIEYRHLYCSCGLLPVLRSN